MSYEGSVGESYLSNEEQRRLLPRMMELNSLIKGLRQHLAEDSEMALKLAREFGPILRRHFNDPKFPGFDLDRVEPPSSSDVPSTSAAT